MAKEWKEFENLVARIEQALSPVGAKVKTNDYVLNILTKKKRQVDATIRYKIGSVPILIIIECRRRKN